MTADFIWTDSLALDVQFGFLRSDTSSPRHDHPQVVLNTEDTSVLRAIRDELRRCESFTFSVAFVSTRAIAMLKQELKDFKGTGRIITSDYLGFNSPLAFAELLNLQTIGIDVRIHQSNAFHPKGYIFERPDGVTAMIGSANLTHTALAQNHEWNLKVSAGADSDLAAQVRELVDREIAKSNPISPAWIDQYAASYVAPLRQSRHPVEFGKDSATVRLMPNRMQRDALKAIAEVRERGQSRAIIISATGTGKTILSALDVRAFAPSRFLFVVHREQVIDRTIEEYRRVLDRPSSDFGKLTGNTKQADRPFLFATIQTLSQPGVLEAFRQDAFDYIVIDEAHRAGAGSHRRVIDYFTPKFLLGMTATPERTDGFNIFELFDYNVPYEIRLNHALEEDMLAPFHYYGVAEITYADGTSVTEDTELSVLISVERVQHLIQALEYYGQAGVAPRGLIFCARKSEALALSEALNGRVLGGRPLRTVALTGDHSIREREEAVERLENDELDYILTVDVFNEGVDIPSINQIVMLRQTQSSIVFVQQLGRGLRKSHDKDYLVVIDFIGAYANNFMIPIALFGDDSLNKESLRKNMIAAEEKGVLPGLSSVRFDEISQGRVLQAIADTKLDAFQQIRTAVLAMRNRVGGPPALWDFVRFESVDPVLLATTRENYPTLLTRVLKIESGLNDDENRALGLLSHEVLPAKRMHEFLLLEAVLHEGRVSVDRAAQIFAEAGLPHDLRHVGSTVDTFTLEFHSEADLTRYKNGLLVRQPNGSVTATPEFARSYSSNEAMRAAVDDLVRTGKHIVKDRYAAARPFTPGMQYSRKEACRILGWPRKWASTLYGYRTDTDSGVCPVFVTLHKSDEISASTAYEDAMLDRSTMRWYTRSNRTLNSPEVAPIVANQVGIHVFVKKDDAEGSDFYYLGQSTAHHAEQTTMADRHGVDLPVVRMLLRFKDPIDSALFDYFHPTVTA